MLRYEFGDLDYNETTEPKTKAGGVNIISCVGGELELTINNNEVIRLHQSVAGFPDRFKFYVLKEGDSVVIKGAGQETNRIQLYIND